MKAIFNTVKVVLTTSNVNRVQMNNIEVKLQLDSGGDITIISEKTWKNIGELTLMKNKSCM